ncbi:hypothetical protein MtrunA17_Chr7g0247171 [Medicago truncatula]|uniref:Uncharacterized protein n=1 Tax=Medicago truncatula TaxID=3880 RepID=A0A396H2G8_MEDTR|nr:hypothetical protein MtrunA17_Chr7g0247171 [Medicago truncatula]
MGFSSMRRILAGGQAKTTLEGSSLFPSISDYNGRFHQGMISRVPNRGKLSLGKS